MTNDANDHRKKTSEIIRWWWFSIPMPPKEQRKMTRMTRMTLFFYPKVPMTSTMADRKIQSHELTPVISQENALKISLKSYGCFLCFPFEITIKWGSRILNHKNLVDTQAFLSLPRAPRRSGAWEQGHSCGPRTMFSIVGTYDVREWTWTSLLISIFAECWDSNDHILHALP